MENETQAKEEIAPQNKSIRVLIADDHELFRAGVAAVLSTDERIEVVGQASDGLNALALFKELQTDVVLLDIMMPVMGGLDALEAIHAHNPQARVIALTTFQGDALIRKAIIAGVSGYLLKVGIRRQLIEAIVRVHDGQRYFPIEVATELTKFMSDHALSKRELDVLCLVAKGNSNRKIGEALLISEDTVKAHIKNLMVKLAANDRTHAVTLAIRRGILME
jgi:DNA-binding NarL/FixJ family response regulator